MHERKCTNYGFRDATKRRPEAETEDDHEDTKTNEWQHERGQNQTHKDKQHRSSNDSPRDLKIRCTHNEFNAKTNVTKCPVARTNQTSRKAKV